MTTVVFETAALQAVLKKAASIAPSRGKAFDQAAGILFQVRPEMNTVIVKSTNMDVYYLEFVSVIEADGEDVDWRLPAHSLNAWVSKLPFGTGKSVTFTPDGKQLRLTSGRARWTTSYIPTEFYPEWEPFNTDDMIEVASLGARLDQVAWAVANDAAQPPLTGIHIDGSYLWATNRYRLARTPCSFPLQGEPITVPASIVAPIIKSMNDTKVGVLGNFLVLAPDDYTQIKVIMYGVPYVDVSRIAGQTHTHSVTFEKQPLADMIAGMTSVSKDRQKELQVFIGDGIMHLYMDEDAGIEVVENVYELDGDGQHERVRLLFAPENFVDAISKGPNDKVTLHYDLSNPSKMIYVDGGSGYSVWTQPKKYTTAESEARGEAAA